MAVVFSDEIEALLAAGPPAIDWDAIEQELKELFLSTRGDPSVVLNCGDEPGEEVSSRTSPERSLVGLRPSRSVDEISLCDRPSCLRFRDTVSWLYVDRPVVVVSADTKEGLLALGAPWVTFSKESVLELNRMGVDCAFTCERAKGKRLEGGVLYRGVSDTENLVAAYARLALLPLTGTVTYVTAHAGDKSILANMFSHMFLNGGRVCGYSKRGSSCGLCGDSGVIQGELCGTVANESVTLPYCVCEAGNRREVRDDEEFERDSGGFIMGRYDGSRSPSPTWSEDWAEYDRGRASDLGPNGLPCVGFDGGYAPYDSSKEYTGVAGSWHEVVSDLPRVGPSIDLEDKVGGDPCQADDEVAILASGQGPFPYGYCYLYMIRQEERLQAARLLGSGPTVKELLLASSSLFDLKSVCLLLLETIEEASDSRQAGRRLHVRPWPCTSASSQPLFEAFAHACADDTLGGDERALAHVLRQVPVSRPRQFLSSWDRVVGCDPCGVDMSEAEERVWVESCVGRGASVPASQSSVALSDKVKGGASGAAAAPGVPADTADKPVKEWCDRCEFRVNMVGHAERCFPRAAQGPKVFEEKVWIGETLLVADVRRALLWRGSISAAERQQECARLVSSSALAGYCDSLEFPPEGMVVSGAVLPGVRMKADAFRRNYRGTFRVDYLRDVLCVTPRELDVTSGLVTHSVGSGCVALESSDTPTYAVVMPPGHGKTYRHGQGRLVEADELCSPKSEDVLVRLKKEARDTGDWKFYSAAWASRLAERAKPGDVVMVPDVDVAEHARFVILGALLLDKDTLARNLGGRSECQVVRCMECYNSVAASSVVKYQCRSNDEVSRTLEALTATFV